MPPSSAEFDDPAFLERLRRGDPDAYRRLIRRFHGSLVGVAASVIGSHAQAEEVVQDAWLAVFAGIGRFEGRAAIGTWLFSIVLNRARTRRGREIRLVALPAEEDALGEAARFAADGHWLEMPRPWDELDPERLVAGRQLWDHVQAAIDRLPAGQRAVIILRDVEGNDAETACELLGISAENQRVLLHRARMRVREAIDALVGGEQRRPAAGRTKRAARIAPAPRRPVAERFAAAFGCIGRWLRARSRPAILPAPATASTVRSAHHQEDTSWPSVRNIRAICSRRAWRFAAPCLAPNTSTARWRAPTISSPVSRS
jgi:RNA polymerase sigma-70 factor (ECF subfamily)